MKKVLVVINNLEIGGVQRSLLNLLKEISNSYDVTLLTFFGKLEYKKVIPKNVKMIMLKSSFKHLGMSKKDTKKNLLLFIARVFWFILTKIFGRSFVVKLMSLSQKKVKGYDYAISYLHEGSQRILYGGCNEFVLNQVQATKKIGWLHCDFARCGGNNAISRKIYAKFDKIVACSEGCRKSFLNCIPECAEKTVSIRNCNDFQAIVDLAQDSIIYNKEFFNIVTVARLSREKGVQRAVNAVKKCIDSGYKVKYHIVGSGDQDEMIREMVSSFGIDDFVVFYGDQNNPYQYIKNADLFLLTSYHEAAPMVFDEAACLGVPIMATETTSTYEMIEQSGYGIVCKNEQDNISETLLNIVSNPEILNGIKFRLKQSVFNNYKTTKKIQEILG